MIKNQYLINKGMLLIKREAVQVNRESTLFISEPINKIRLNKINKMSTIWMNSFIKILNKDF